ncbi:hypothetical protein DOTSEDRAFT_49194 [Dothistroma septosporum NZE10]|uniref:Plastocyanin-like domain-containing protein n=1 Tax=Dothistroma septosporum (strain NZE10 / CBS 128990) TaxID=675120 RepID=N1PZ32_DOTSN|nr:hypothetical protein DOTSEDRAFT_49194 [Dothistroma septosporum NZE10]
MERTKSQKKWWICLFFAGVLTTGALLFFLYPKFEFARTWAADTLYAGAGPKIAVDAGHGPVAWPETEAPEAEAPDAEALDDLSVRLHPEQQSWRWPDGAAKELYSINDDFPGPRVEVQSGDQVVVQGWNELHNQDV